MKVVINEHNWIIMIKWNCFTFDQAIKHLILLVICTQTRSNLISCIPKAQVENKIYFRKITET